MDRAKSSIVNPLTLGMVLVVLGWLSGNSALLYAQTKGTNAVVSGTGSPQSSYAFVDVTPYGTDICAAITGAFTDYNSLNKTVVDARGLSGSALSCTTSDPNPWSTSPRPERTIVLLPPGTITIYNTWILGSDTKLIGEGPNLTVIESASGSSFSGSDIIDMGSQGTTSNPSLYCPQDPTTMLWLCNGIVIEHLAVEDGSSLGLNGIVNEFSEELSALNDVAIVTKSGTGLLLGKYTSTSGFADANNSGPYSNIYFSGSGPCVDIVGLNETRGIHGLHCDSSGTSGAVVYLDGTNNSIEDAYISGGSGQDGILIGSQDPAQANVILNVTGSGLGNVVHIYNSSVNVADLTLMGITRLTGTNTIKDELTSSASTPLTDMNVGMYLVGEAVPGGGGYSRFTTSTSAKFPTWVIGSNAPSGTCATGSLFSCTSSSGSCSTVSKTLWGCAGSSWTGIK